VDERFAQVDEQFAGVNERITGLDDRITGLERKMDAQHQDVMYILDLLKRATRITVPSSPKFASASTAWKRKSASARLAASDQGTTFIRVLKRV
jgi:hypothetical protein